MKLNLTLGMTAVVCATLVLSGCGSDNNTSGGTTGTSGGTTTSGGATTPRFSTVAKGSDIVEQDNQSKLEWVGSAGSNGVNACMPSHADEPEMTEVAEAEVFCDTLVFAGSDDWRVGTVMENKAHVLGMQEQGLTPYYLVPTCPRVIGVDANKSASTVNTHNTTGVVGDLTPLSVLEQQASDNFGVKCVRDY